MFVIPKESHSKLFIKLFRFYGMTKGLKIVSSDRFGLCNYLMIGLQEINIILQFLLFC